MIFLVSLFLSYFYSLPSILSIFIETFRFFLPIAIPFVRLFSHLFTLKHIFNFFPYPFLTLISFLLFSLTSLPLSVLSRNRSTERKLFRAFTYTNKGAFCFPCVLGETEGVKSWPEFKMCIVMYWSCL